MGRYVAVVVLIALATAARADVVAPLTSIPLTFGLMSMVINITENNETSNGTSTSDNSTMVTAEPVLRAYAEVGGRMLQVDSGSSAIAFCEEPLGVQDATPLLNGEGKELAGFQQYGLEAESPFWFGKAYAGGLPWGSSGSTFEANYTIMEEVESANGYLEAKTLLDDDICATPSPNSHGITKNDDGIFGIGYNGAKYIPSKDLTYADEGEGSTLSWDLGDPPSKEDISNMNSESSFMRSIRSLPPEEQKFALTWNGSLGPNTGALLIGREAVLNQSVGTSFWPTATPKAIMRISEEGWYQFIVMGLYLEDRDGDDPVLINQTETTNASFGDPPGVKYVFDSGNPKISLPLETKSQILTILDARNITDFTLVFTIADLWKGPPAVILKFDLNLTMFDTFQFVDTSEGEPPVWGLPTMAFLQEVRFFVGGSADKNCTLGCSMDKDGKELVSYMQFVEREREDGDRILYSLVNDPEALLVQ